MLRRRKKHGFVKTALIVGILFFVVLTTNIFAQELTKLVDIPTAGILQKGEINFQSLIYKNGGICFGAGVGIIPKLMFGMEYGGESVIGNEKPNWDEYPGVYVKYRIFDESPKTPALAVGFDSRGYGAFLETDIDTIKVNRYELKSKGFYTVLSQNFNFLGELGIHVGANYSIERDDNDDNLNCFLGIDKSLNNQIGFFSEYDFAFNDNGKSGNAETYSFGEDNGYLNAALYLNISDNIRLQLNFRDILNNQYDEPDRSLTIQYSSQI
ncbi:MAG: hypothetical protein U9P79_07620 [Candidatus Cloacimonadota bacterium]|nr:hypothetical protein [Candidatus Cloacimonadota bacterium]